MAAIREKKSGRRARIIVPSSVVNISVGQQGTDALLSSSTLYTSSTSEAFSVLPSARRSLTVYLYMQTLLSLCLFSAGVRGSSFFWG